MDQHFPGIESRPRTALRACKALYPSSILGAASSKLPVHRSSQDGGGAPNPPDGPYGGELSAPSIDVRSQRSHLLMTCIPTPS